MFKDDFLSINKRVAGGFFYFKYEFFQIRRLQAGYVTSCRAFSAAFDGEGHFLTFVQRFVTIVLDSREVYEQDRKSVV